MAVRKQVETCMFCMPDPCTCNQKKPAPRKALKAQPKRETVTVQLPEPERSGISAVRKSETKDDKEQAEYRRALTVLCMSGMVSAYDINANRHDLDLTFNEVEALLWRQRRVEWLARPRRELRRR